MILVAAADFDASVESSARAGTRRAGARTRQSLLEEAQPSALCEGREIERQAPANTTPHMAAGGLSARDEDHSVEVDQSSVVADLQPVCNSRPARSSPRFREEFTMNRRHVLSAAAAIGAALCAGTLPVPAARADRGTTVTVMTRNL